MISPPGGGYRSRACKTDAPKRCYQSTTAKTTEERWFKKSVTMEVSPATPVDTTEVKKIKKSESKFYNTEGKCCANTQVKKFVKCYVKKT